MVFKRRSSGKIADEAAYGLSMALTKKQKGLWLGGATLGIGLVATVAVANPFSHGERTKWVKLKDSSSRKTLFKSSQCKLRFYDKKNGSWTRWEVDARKLRSNLSCKSGACIKEQIKPQGGSYSSPTQKSFIPTNRAHSSTVWGRALRCHPWTIPAPNGLSWSYRSGDPTGGTSKTISISGSRRHASDGRAQNLGICRVMDRGTTFIGTMYNKQGSNQQVFVYENSKYLKKTVSGHHTITQCVINHNDHKLTGGDEWSGEHYFNFQYLSGNISESRWTTSSNTSLAAPAATMDGNAAFICMRGWNYTKENGTTGQTMRLGLRAFGFRKPGENHCYTARIVPHHVTNTWGNPTKTTWLLKK